jgi:allantoinase
MSTAAAPGSGAFIRSSAGGLPLTVFGVAMALARHPDIVAAIKAADYDVVSHGWRWIHYQHMDIDMEREHLHKAVQVLTDLFGKPPTGWYTGRDSPNTRRLVVEHGGFDYDSDYYGDDLPWTEVPCTVRAASDRPLYPRRDMPLRAYRSVLYLPIMCCSRGEDAPKMMIGMCARRPLRPCSFPRLCQQHERVGLYAPAIATGAKFRVAPGPSAPG